MSAMFLIATFICFLAAIRNSDGFIRQQTTWQNLRPTLVPRHKMLHPSISRLILSPDGKNVAFLNASNGIDMVWIQDLVHQSTPRLVASEPNSKIMFLEWTCLPGILLFYKDNDGDENYKLYSVNITMAKPVPKRLSDEKAKSYVKRVSCKYPETLIVSSNDRDARYFDLYKMDLKTGDKVLLYQNNEFNKFVFDNDLRLRLASKFNENGGIDIYELENSTWSIIWKFYVRVPFLDYYTTEMLSFDASNTKIYWTDAICDLASLYISDFDTPTERKLIYEAKSADVSNVIFNECKSEPIILMEDDGYPSYYAIDSTIQADLDYLNSLAPVNSRLRVLDTSYDFCIWLIHWQQDNKPAHSAIYDRVAGRITHNFHHWPDLENYQFARTKPITLVTRDAYVQLCYLTVPIEYVPRDGQHHTTQPMPMVLYVHGGPWSVRHFWRFHTRRQFLANRGYAILECNYRASGGFGKIWLNAGNGEWGRKMHYDLLDAVDWAVQDGVADRDRIAIMGYSYGGYATLVGMTETPDVFACGIDGFGVSNLETFLRSVPPYWLNLWHLIQKRIGGSLETEEGLQFLHSRSPYFSAHKIKRPLLIFQGANDQRVKRNESDNIVRAMQAANIPVSYVFFPDEGHGFNKEKNKAAEFAIVEQFLRKCLDGRAQDIGDDVENSSAQIISRGTVDLV